LGVLNRRGTQLLRQVLDAFKQRNPTIKVNELRARTRYPTQQLARFAARKSPDVFYVGLERVPGLAQAKALGGPAQPEWSSRTHFIDEHVLSRLLKRLQVREARTTVPEGLDAARDGDQ
jgi:hypothetical protein